MLIDITPTTVDGTPCAAVDVSVAASTSVAIRVVPVDGDGVPIGTYALGISLGQDDPRVADLLTAIAAVVEPIVGSARAKADFSPAPVAAPAVEVSRDDMLTAAIAKLNEASAALDAATAKTAEPVDVKVG